MFFRFSGCPTQRRSPPPNQYFCSFIQTTSNSLAIDLREIRPQVVNPLGAPHSRCSGVVCLPAPRLRVVTRENIFSERTLHPRFPGHWLHSAYSTCTVLDTSGGSLGRMLTTTLSIIFPAHLYRKPRLGFNPLIHILVMCSIDKISCCYSQPGKDR